MFCVRFTGRSSRPSLTGFSLSVCMGAFSFLAPFASPLPLPLRWLVLARPVSPPAVSCLLALVSRSPSLRSPASLAPPCSSSFRLAFLCLLEALGVGYFFSMQLEPPAHPAILLATQLFKKYLPKSQTCRPAGVQGGLRGGQRGYRECRVKK